MGATIWTGFVEVTSCNKIKWPTIIPVIKNGKR